MKSLITLYITSPNIHYVDEAIDRFGDLIKPNIYWYINIYNLIIHSNLENILFNQETNDEKFYAAMKYFEYTPLFYFYLPLLSDDIFKVISKQKPPTYDFFTLRNNKNQSIFHVLFAFSIYIK